MSFVQNTDDLCDLISEASVKGASVINPVHELHLNFSIASTHPPTSNNLGKEFHKKESRGRPLRTLLYKITSTYYCTMAEEFCRALFQTSNVVPSSDTEDQNCVICLEKTGEMSRETGLVDLQVRLPCRHSVGSGCIAVWLKTQNSCPLCRRVFFPIDEEEYPEDFNVQDQEGEYEEEGDRWEDQEEVEETEDMLLKNCQDYGTRLVLDNTTIRIARAIVKLAWRTYPFRDLIGTICDDNAVYLIGLAIYIASRFTDRPRSPREICDVSDVDGLNCDQIRHFYLMIYGQRERLINDVIEESLEGRDRVWPSIDPNDESDHHIETSRDLPAVRAHCDQECADLQVPPLIVDLAQHIAANVTRAGFHSIGLREDCEYLNKSEITGVSIYIASHLLGQPLSRRSLQDRIGYHFEDVRSRCVMIRDKCAPLVRDDFCETRGIRVSWESLEADIGKESPDDRHENQGEEDIEMISADTREERLMELCDDYCDRLRVVWRTGALAQRLCERFSALKTLDGRRLESIAMICVYIACFCEYYHQDYMYVVAITGLSINSVYTTHLIMAQEIVIGRVNVQDLAESFNVQPRRFRTTLPEIGTDELISGE